MLSMPLHTTVGTEPNCTPTIGPYLLNKPSKAWHGYSVPLKEAKFPMIGKGLGPGRSFKLFDNFFFDDFSLFVTKYTSTVIRAHVIATRIVLELSETIADVSIFEQISNSTRDVSDTKIRFEQNNQFNSPKFTWIDEKRCWEPTNVSKIVNGFDDWMRGMTVLYANPGQKWAEQLKRFIIHQPSMATIRTELKQSIDSNNLCEKVEYISSAARNFNEPLHYR